MEITRRPALDSDTDFAREIHHRAYHDVCVRQYGPWDEQAQDKYFLNDWNVATFEVVLCNDVPCGYTYIEERSDDIHVREIVVHPDFQNRGVGSALLHEIMERAQERRVPVRLGTCRKNRAFDLYRRLGFEEYDRTDTHILLQWNPEATGSHMELKAFLARYPSFGGWSAEWDGVPLQCRTSLSDELPPRSFVGSVRALVLRGDEVLLVHSSPPNLVIGGRCEPGETIEQTLLREVGEETGWLVRPIAVIGFGHCCHLDDQRPDWGRPAPDFVDPIFAVTAIKYDPSLLVSGETQCEFVPIVDVERFGIESINRTFLREALRKRSEAGTTR